MHLGRITALRLGVHHRVSDALTVATATLSSLAILAVAAQLPASAQALLPSPRQAFGSSGNDRITNNELHASLAVSTPREQRPLRKPSPFASRAFDAVLSPALAADSAANDPFSPSYRFWPFHSQLSANGVPVGPSSLSMLSRIRKRFDVDAFTKRFDVNAFTKRFDVEAFGDTTDDQWMEDRRRKRFDINAYGFLPTDGKGYYNYYRAPSAYDDDYGLVTKRSRRAPLPPQWRRSTFDENDPLASIFYVGRHQTPADATITEQKRSRTFL